MGILDNLGSIVSAVNKNQSSDRNGLLLFIFEMHHHANE